MRYFKMDDMEETTLAQPAQQKKIEKKIKVGHVKHKEMKATAIIKDKDTTYDDQNIEPDSKDDLDSQFEEY
jgi:hypothetical protein